MVQVYVRLRVVPECILLLCGSLNNRMGEKK